MEHDNWTVHCLISFREIQTPRISRISNASDLRIIISSNDNVSDN